MNSKIIIPIAFTLLCTLAAKSQITIKGRVTDSKLNSLAGISVGVKGGYDGGTSDSSGYYSFKLSEKADSIIIYASSVGFKKYEQRITVTSATVLTDIVLAEEITELKAVVISAGSFEASDQKRNAVLKTLDVATTASANADVTSAIRTLPGTQQMGQSEGLFVRGGSAEETKIFIDGTLVNNFFYSSVPEIPQRGRFSPFLFKGLVFCTGGYSALYGQALSSALILESVDLPETSSGSINVSSVGVNNFSYEKLSKNKNTSAGISYSYLNLSPYFKIIPQNVDYFRPPVYNNIEVNFRIKLPKNGILKFYSYLNENNVGVTYKDIDSAGLKNSFILKNKNLYSNLSLKQNICRSWKLLMGVSFSTNNDKIIQELQNMHNRNVLLTGIPYAYKNFNLENTNSLGQVRTVFEKKLKGLTAIRFGGEYHLLSDKIAFVNLWINNRIAKYTEHFKALFAEADVYITNDIALKAGGRYEYSSIISKGRIAPRVSLAYKLANKGQLSAAYGIFYQKPDRDILLWNTNLNYQKAIHYIVNYQKITLLQTFRVELFYKKYDNFIKTFPDTANSGNGYAKGLDIFWRDKKTIKGFDYWVSYSYLDSKRNYLNYPNPLSPNYAATHTASLIIKKFISKIKLTVNASYTYSSGRPYFDLKYDNPTNKYNIAQQGKTIDYHNLNLGFYYTPNIGKPNEKKQVVWILTVTNIPGNKQIFNYRYSYNGQSRQEVIPPAKRFIFLGCFISFGVDRTQEAINNTL
jgi:vitamin B12 transporter